MSDKIIAIIELDRFPGEVASRAALLAKLYECDLHLLLSDPTVGILRQKLIVSNEAKEIAKNITTAQQRLLADLSDSVAAENDMVVTTAISHDRPASDAIIAAALEIEPRFVVKGTYFHSAAERATIVEVDWQLIRRLDYPLWLVKPAKWKDPPVIIAAVDPTHADDESGSLDQGIVDLGKELARQSGGSMMLFHTYERLVEIGTYATFEFKPVKVPVDELDENLKTRHRKLLNDLAAANDIPHEDVHQLPGRTRELLPTFARAHGASVVIMGAVCRTGFKRRVLGSTAEQVLDHLPCDILIARGG